MNKETGSAFRTVVVFIHGFMGSPRQFDKLAQSVKDEGYSTTSLLLPGHGSTVKEFSSVTMEEWQSYVNAEIERLSPDYDDIFLVGHSMGCLLAINAAVMNTANFRGLFLMACPLKLRIFSAHALKLRTKIIFYRKSHPIKATYIASNSIPPRLSLIWRIIKPTVELKKLIRITKGNLQNVSVPVTAVFSLDDELVSLDSLDILKNNLNQASFNSMILSDSLHSYYPEHEHLMIENALISAIQHRFHKSSALASIS